jgi:hypothetical protein
MSSGVVHSKGLEPIDFVFSNEMTLRITVKEVKGESSAIDLVPEGNLLTMNFINPHSQLHFGPADPIQVGSYLGRELFIQIRINTFGTFVSYGVEYTFYQGAKIG